MLPVSTQLAMLVCFVSSGFTTVGMLLRLEVKMAARMFPLKRRLLPLGILFCVAVFAPTLIAFTLKEAVMQDGELLVAIACMPAVTSVAYICLLWRLRV